MKFPSARSPFGELPPLHPQHAQRLSDTAAALVDEAIDEYDRFVRVHKRRLARSEWKPVKKLENLTLYRQRRSSPGEATDAGRQSHSAVTASASAPFEVEPDRQHLDWSLPKIVTVGTLPGSLEDVMLGVSAPDAAAVLRKAAYSKEEVVDADVLYPIAQPTEAAPFAFLGVKWMLVDIHAMSRRRDIVYLESTGVRKLPDGRRIGFVLTHSLDDLEGCQSLERSSNVLRLRISSCYLFTPADVKAPTPTVEVYMKGFVQPNGNMVDTFAISTSASAILQFFAHAVECAQHRKLAHQLEATPEAERQLAQREDPQQRPRSATSSWLQRRIRGDKDKAKCGVCHASAGALSALKLFRSTSGDGAGSQGGASGLGACELCARQVCARCRRTRKLWLAAPSAPAGAPRTKQLRQLSVSVCTACVVESSQLDAEDVARADVRAMTSAGSGRKRSTAGVIRPLAVSECAPSPASTHSSVRSATSNASSMYSPICGWHRQYASMTMRASTPAAVQDFPTRQEAAEMEAQASTAAPNGSRQAPALESVVEVNVRTSAAPRGERSVDAEVVTALQPASASILVVEQPDDAVKPVVTVSESDRRTRGKSQPVSESESTDRESSFDGDDAEDVRSDAVVVFSERPAASTTSGSGIGSEGCPSDAQSQLWARIAELRRNAEDVYQMTLRTTVNMGASVRKATPMDDLD